MKRVPESIESERTLRWILPNTSQENAQRRSGEMDGGMVSEDVVAAAMEKVGREERRGEREVGNFSPLSEGLLGPKSFFRNRSGSIPDVQNRFGILRTNSGRFGFF